MTNRARPRHSSSPGPSFAWRKPATSRAGSPGKRRRGSRAQQIAAQQSPSIGSLSTLAIYEYFAGDFAAGDKAVKQTKAKATSKEEAKNVEKQLAEFRKRGKQFEKQKQETAKLQQETGKESLQNPFGGLGGASSLGE